MTLNINTYRQPRNSCVTMEAKPVAMGVNVYGQSATVIHVRTSPQTMKKLTDLLELRGHHIHRR